ncbi:MAG TPA: DUF6588 family protein [Bacteroidales bacterium]|nr:DUF6588 family protein [Bacteroidales bacterium]
MNIKRSFVYCMLTFLLVIPAFPQDIEGLISKYTEENGKGYMQPFADAFGANLNTGLFHSAQIEKLGFQLYIGVKASTAFITDKRRTFMATTEGSFTPEQTAEVPTVFGPAESVEVSGNGGTVYVFPGGLNVTMLPFVIPQLTLGSVFGTDLTLRYFTYSLDEEIGKLEHFGWGIRHSISQYIPGLPVDLAVGIYNQHFSVGDIVESNTWLISAQASRRVLLFTFYGGLGYEKALMNIEYDQEDGGSIVSFDLTGSNSIRFTAGVTFNLGPVKLNVDYSLASQSVLCAGLGIGIGN